MWLSILSTVLATVFLTVVFLNLRAGEKQIRYILAHEFSVEHPQFLRSMGNLLGAGLRRMRFLTSTPVAKQLQSPGPEDGR